MLHHDYKSCVSISNVAFYLQTGHLTLQTRASVTIVAFRLSNVEVRITFKLYRASLLIYKSVYISFAIFFQALYVKPARN